MGRTDDGSVHNEEALWRRILPVWMVKEPDGRLRPSSVAFLDRCTGELSVHRAKLTSTTFILRAFPTHSVAEVRAKVPRELKLAVCADPICGERDLADDPS